MSRWRWNSWDRTRDAYDERMALAQEPQEPTGPEGEDE